MISTVPSERAYRPWVHVVCALAAAAVVWVATSSTFFHTDDFTLLHDAQAHPVSVSWLRSPIYEHFSPMLHLNMKLVTFAGDHGIPSPVGARLVILVWLAALALVLNRLLRELSGPGAAAVLLTAYGILGVWHAKLLSWWTASAHFLPCAFFSVLSITYFWRHLREPRARAAGLALLTYALALLCHEKAVFVSVYLGLIALLYGRSATAPRWFDPLLQRWQLFLGVTLLTLASIVNYRLGYYHKPPHATFPLLVAFTKIALVETVMPALVGVRTLDATSVMLAGLASAVVITATFLAVRAGARRSVVFLWSIILANIALLGPARAGMWGPVVAWQLWYYVELGFLVPVALAMALGEMRLPRRVLRVGAGAASILYVLALILSYPRLNAEAKVTVEPRRLFTHLGQAIAALPTPPAIFNGQAGWAASFFWNYPNNRFDRQLRVVFPKLSVNDYPEARFHVTDDGELVPASFHVDSSILTSSPASSHGLRAGQPGCFVVEAPDAELTFKLAKQVARNDLFALFRYHVQNEVTLGSVAIADGVRAALSESERPFRPGERGHYEDLSVEKLDAVSLINFRVGDAFCLDGIDIGHVEATAPQRAAPGAGGQVEQAPR